MLAPNECEVPGTGLEPANPYGHIHLKDARLPISPSRLVCALGEIRTPTPFPALVPETSLSTIPAPGHIVVGVVGLEPTTSRSQSAHSSQLSYTPVPGEGFEPTQSNHSKGS